MSKSVLLVQLSGYPHRHPAIPAKERDEAFDAYRERVASFYTMVVYKVLDSTNTTSPKIDDYLTEEEVNELSAKSISFRIKKAKV